MSKQPPVNLAAFRDSRLDNFMKREKAWVWGIIIAALIFPFIGPILGLHTPVFIIVSCSLFVVIPVYAIAYTRGQHKLIMQVLQQFARDNNFEFVPDPKWKSAGVIFQVGRKHTSRYLLHGQLHGYPVVAYWLTSVTGSGKHQQTHHYGVAEIELPKVVPHIFIDDRRNNFLGSELLNNFRRDHLVQLEGDFPQHYNIFAAKEYEIEVLTILNPAFMAKLVEKVNKEEIELLDNTAFIYCDNMHGPGEANIFRLFGEADFLITQLQKQLDTFRFQVDPKHPNQIKPSWLRRLA